MNYEEGSLPAWDPHAVLIRYPKEMPRRSTSDTTLVRYKPWDPAPYSMTEPQLEARNDRKNHGRFGKQLFVCLTVTLGSISAGFTTGSVCPMIHEQFQKSDYEYHPEFARFASIVTAGLATGNLVLAIISTVRGPRKIMIFGALFHIIAWLVIATMNTMPYRKACMFFCAFFSISYIRCGAILMMDGIHEAYYYVFFLIFNSGPGFGIMLGYIFGFHPHLSYYAEGFAVFILCTFFIMLFFCPESPVFLYRNHRHKAELAMIYFRGKEDIRVLMRQINKDREGRELTVSTKYLFTYRVVYKPTIIIITVAVLQCFYAYHIFLMYDVSLWFTSSKYKRVSIFGGSIDGAIYGVVYYVTPLIAESINLRMTFGLRKPILVSAISVPCTLVVHCVFYYCVFHTDYLDGYEWLSFGVRFAHILCVNFSHNWCLDTMISTYLPEQVQIWAVIGVYTVKYVVVSFLFWFTFMMETILGATVITSIFAVVSFAGIPFCYYFIIESKGKTLRQVQLAIGGNPIGTRFAFTNRCQQYFDKENSKKKKSSRKIVKFDL